MKTNSSTHNSNTVLQSVPTPNSDTVSLATDSAYQLTPVYTNPEDGNLVFGLRIQLAPQDNDRLVTVTMATENRPDTISAFYQGDPALWWLIADLTQMVDPLLQFQMGTQLRFSPNGLNR